MLFQLELENIPSLLYNAIFKYAPTYISQHWKSIINFMELNQKWKNNDHILDCFFNYFYTRKLFFLQSLCREKL